MAVLIKGNNANELWLQAKNVLSAEGIVANDTKELLHVMFELDDPQQKWVSCRRPSISIGFVLAELMWILNGDNKTDIIDFWNPSYAKYTADEGEDTYHGAYGYRLRKNYGLDQLERAYNALKNNPTNRQTVMLYWDPRKDMPREDGSKTSNDIPCNVCFLLKLRDGVLDWTQIMRSNDIFMGLPYNLVQFTGLHEIMAGWLGVRLGKYIHYSDSLHLYNRNVDAHFDANENTANNDSLAVPKDKYNDLISEIYVRMHRIIQQKMSSEELLNIGILGSEFQAYNNIMLIITAYAANKLNKFSVAQCLVEKCTNEVYKIMWSNYISKKNNHAYQT